MSCKQFIRQVDTAVNDKMFGQKYGPRKMTLEKTCRREVSSPESETVKKGSKSGAPAEIGRYHMYGIYVNGKVFEPLKFYCSLFEGQEFDFPLMIKSFQNGSYSQRKEFHLQGQIVPSRHTVQILCIGTDRSQQTVQTKIRLLLKK